MVGFGVSLFVTGAALADGPQTGTIQGTISGDGGNGLPGVSVTLAGTQVERTVTTDADGQYRFGVLPPDTYAVKAELEGLGAADTSLRLDAGQRRTVNLTLRLATAETIQVTAEAPLVNKYDVATTTTLEAEVAEELIFASRNYQSAVTLMPGVLQNGDSQALGDHRPSVNGGNWQETAGFIDGVDTSFSRLGGSSQIFVPTSVLSEVRIEGAGYGAEYGRVTGGVTNAVVKSGTSTLHGELLYIPQSQKWRASYDALDLERDDEIHDTVELSVGGPIVRDRAWFFVGYSDKTTNQLGATGDGSPVDSSFDGESRVVKLNFQPSQRHSLYLLGIDAPHFFANASNPAFFEPLAVAAFDLTQELLQLSWSYGMSSSQFLEARAARQTSNWFRTALADREIDPGASPDDPAGNRGMYQDLATGFRRNAIGSALGGGDLEFPREQANAALSWFTGIQELKFGLDFQQVGWNTLSTVPDRYLGRNFDSSRPGGFVTPQLKRVFTPSDGVIETESQNLALFVQDRLSWGDHWTVTAGLRLEDQNHDNDLGQTVVESTDLGPRIAAVYDTHANGILLIKGTAGRYYHHIAQELINDQFSVKPNGANEFDEFQWNPATQRYDRFRRHVVPVADTVVAAIEAYYKDEVTLGFEWQFAPLWAFEARAIYQDFGDLLWVNDQFDGNGEIFTLVASRPEGKRTYEALQLELNRSFRNNWVLRSNYTLGNTEGNLFGRIDDVNPFLEAQSVVDPSSGQPLTAINYFGRGPEHRTHILNVAGHKRVSFGKQDLTLGGFFWYRSGEPWGLTTTTSVDTPTGGTINLTTRPEPRDARELDDSFSLNLTAGWNFPIVADWSGTLRLEVANVTDEQEIVNVNTNTGQTVMVPASFQLPREFRLVAGVRF